MASGVAYRRKSAPRGVGIFGALAIGTKKRVWIPAQAGMTKLSERDTCLTILESLSTKRNGGLG